MNLSGAPLVAERMAEILSWLATVATVAAACMTASNLGSRITGYGFAVFTVGSVCWLWLGLVTGQPALVWTNVALTLLNIFGVWRWLGRQAKVEEGAVGAAEASESTPGEALFPVSLMTKARLATKDSELGTCVEAMAGCRSGRVAYVIVSEGGVAGLGERLRRLPWDDAYMDGQRLVTTLDARQFCALPEIESGRWPER